MTEEAPKDTIQITFKNDVSEQTHIFLTENLNQEGFFGGLVANPMKETTTKTATVLFDKSISFKFMDGLFEMMEELFKKGNLRLIPFTGQFIYQVDKLLDYFLCHKFKTQILEVAAEIVHEQDSDYRLDYYEETQRSPSDMAHIILTLYDNKGFQYTKNWLVEWFHRLKSLDMFFPLFQELMEIANELPTYTTKQTIQVMQLANTIRNNISPEMLQNAKLSEILLMRHADVEEYLTYEKPPAETPLYFLPAATAEISGQMITTEDEAKLRFTMISQGKLAKMPWRNVIVAGGSVNLMLDATLNPGNYPASDIDLFVYGATKEERQAAVTGLLAYFDGLPGGGRKFYAVKQSVVSIFIDDCPTSFQIIAGNAATILDVLHHFDLEHLRMAYQDGQFYLTLEAVEALKTKTTHVHGYGTNIYRIWKTINRGYNIVDNGDLVLNTDRMAFMAPDSIWGTNNKHLVIPKKLDFKDLKTKFGFDKYKYYIPRKEESAEKVVYEIHLHNRCKPDQVVRTVAEVKARLELEGDFKTQAGKNGYMGNTLDIKSENIVLDWCKHNVTYLKIMYRHRDGVGHRNQYITYRSPACYATISSYTADSKNFSKDPINLTLSFENKDFLKFMQLQENMVMEKVHEESYFKKWFNKQTNEIRHYIPKIDLKYGMLTAKIRPENAGIFLSNGMQLKTAKEVGAFLENGKNSCRRVKCDIFLDKFVFDLSKTEYFFVYTIKTIRMMEEVHLSLPALKRREEVTVKTNNDDDGEDDAEKVTELDRRRKVVYLNDDGDVTEAPFSDAEDN